jgi:S-disulfanyl-L-cysteine oxidoreductase SoxD
MFKSKLALALFLLIPAAQIYAQTAYKNIGRPATSAEIKAWDIDVRPDFKGLPPGKGSVAKGQEVWEAKCESCHGTFGESGEVFTPISGGITKQAIATGRVETLIDGKTPIRSTMMKVATVSTLWDYINRAMPWNAPKSLSVEEVYASVAYVLHLNDIVPADFTLSNENIAEIQKKMPNRNGMTTAHGLFSARGTPDVKVAACMSDCKSALQVSSALPDYARNSHGNLIEQTRNIGTRGVTTEEKKTGSPTAQSLPHPAIALLGKHSCTACHGMEAKLVGPGFAEIRKKYADKPDGLAYLTKKIKEGGAGVWGAIPMPAQAQLSGEETNLIAAWLAK